VTNGERVAIFFWWAEAVENRPKNLAHRRKHFFPGKGEKAFL
jgi:hypothetical protein